MAVSLLAVAVVLRVEYGIRLTPSGLSGPKRLVPEVVVASTGGPFAYSQTHAGEPVTYSPCKPLPVVVNSALMPPGADGLVEEAVAHVASRTGLDLHIEGDTNEEPTSLRASRLRQYGDRWPPALLAWSDPSGEPALAGEVVGVGGSTAVRTTASGRPRYVTGVVALDSPDLAATLELPAGRDLVRAVIMHELAHLVGLDHVDDLNELMYHGNVGVTAFGPGDLEGLANLGRGSCL